MIELTEGRRVRLLVALDGGEYPVGATGYLRHCPTVNGDMTQPDWSIGLQWGVVFDHDEAGSPIVISGLAADGTHPLLIDVVELIMPVTDDTDEDDRLAREQHALAMLAEDAARDDDDLNPFNLPTCYACGRPVASDSGVCGVCGADIDINGDMLIEAEDSADQETPPTADQTGQAWGVIDGQTIDEATVRRLIRQKADAMERARLNGFALNHALQMIVRLELELGGYETAAYFVTPAGYDWLAANGYDDPPKVGA